MPYVAYKFRVYPNTHMVSALTEVLDLCREVYNACIEERREAYNAYKNGYTQKKSISYEDQANQLPEIKQERPDLKKVGSQVLQDVCKRVHRAYQGFYSRVARAEKAGFPRFKGAKRYNSFTYPGEAGWNYTPGNQVSNTKLGPGYLTLTNHGTIRVKQHRPIDGEIKTGEIVREGPHWSVVFVSEVPVSDPLPASDEQVGIDVGIKVYAALSTGEMIKNPKIYRGYEKDLARLQQSRAKKQKGSTRYKQLTRQMAKLHRHIANTRKDFQHKEAKKLVDRFQLIAMEDLQLKNLSRKPKPKQDEEGTYLPNGASAKAGLNKSILDAAWGQFTTIIRGKAAKAGRTLILVNPSNTTQRCSRCHHLPSQPIGLDVRTYVCEYCGLVIDRDTNSAITILELAVGPDAPVRAT